MALKAVRQSGAFEALVTLEYYPGSEAPVIVHAKTAQRMDITESIDVSADSVPRYDWPFPAPSDSIVNWVTRAEGKAVDKRHRTVIGMSPSQSWKVTGPQ
jgi:hypothetical protein